ncbi:MAG: hypothetical protein AUJ04_00155 [Acidobacteria bacterium 13_1_40CM_3_55_6]|nr:MAG: hypothetical protein AUJ04_00155 [Acidobacteria bacterium 13_1_40CM_3_55_6]
MDAQGLKRSEVANQHGIAEGAIKRLDRQLSQALLLRDSTTLDDLIADDYTFTNPLGEVTNKTLTMAGIDSGLLLHSLDIKNVTVQIYGDTASVSGVATIEGWFKTRDINGLYRYSDVYMRRHGRWQVVATQAVRVEEQ